MSTASALLPEPGSRPQLDRDDPWPGLESYDETSRAFFSGRRSEIDELLRRILDEPVTLLFGKSGLGKTSLLKAGVFPRLRERDHVPVYLRLQVRPGAPPLASQATEALRSELEAQRVDHPPLREGETLWEYLHRRGLELWSHTNRLVRPVFVLDQFEEVFTLGRSIREEVERFRHDLADLAENRVPPPIARRLEELVGAEADLDLRAMPYRIVVALREDFLADLEAWRASMPSLRRNRMRLLPMGPEQALEAIRNELTRHLVSEPLAAKVLAFLASVAGNGSGDAAAEGGAPPEAPQGGELPADATVEPALLSLFCRGVNQERKREGKPAFDEALVERAKGTIVSQFYRDALDGMPEEARRFIEEELVTEQGFRNSYSVDDALAHGHLDVPTLEALVQRRLLRTDYHFGAERVELTHDLLTKAVVQERDRRRKAERIAEDRRQRRRSWTVAGASLAVAAAFAVVALYAFQSSELAGEQQRRAEAGELAAHARSLVAKAPQVATLVALEAVELADTPETRSALIESLLFTWPTATLSDPAELGGQPTGIALSPDGARLAVLSAKDQVTLWDVTGAGRLSNGTSERPARIWAGPVPEPPARASSSRVNVSIAFSPDGEAIAFVRANGIAILDAATGALTSTTSVKDGVEAIAFSPDGRRLAATVQERRILVWNRDAMSSEPARIENRSIRGVKEVAFGSSPQTLVALVDAKEGGLKGIRLEEVDGRWPSAAVDAKACVRPRSISQGRGRVAAVFGSVACIYEEKREKRASNGRGEADDWVEADDRVIEDVVWNSSGTAYVQVLANSEAIVRQRTPEVVESRIKGFEHLPGDVLTSIVSLSDDAMRLAAIDRRGAVKVYSLGADKVMFAPVASKDLLASPDGKWVALARSHVSPRPAEPPGRKVEIDIVSVDGFEAGQRQAARVVLELRDDDEVLPSHEAIAISRRSGSAEHRRDVELFALDGGGLASRGIVPMLPDDSKLVLWDAGHLLEERGPPAPRPGAPATRRPEYLVWQPSRDRGAKALEPVWSSIGRDGDVRRELGAFRESLHAARKSTQPGVAPADDATCRALTWIQAEETVRSFSSRDPRRLTCELMSDPGRGQLLVPLRPSLAKGFARWLVGGRKLTEAERCEYLPDHAGSAKCSAQIPPPRRSLRRVRPAREEASSVRVGP